MRYPHIILIWYPRSIIVVSEIDVIILLKQGPAGQQWVLGRFKHNKHFQHIKHSNQIQSWTAGQQWVLGRFVLVGWVLGQCVLG